MCLGSPRLPAGRAGRRPQRVGIGSGSGYLRYPDAQAALKLQPGDTLYVNPGTYSGLSLGNLSGTAGSPITVVCDPKAVFTTVVPQSNDFPNIAHVRFENFRFETYNGTCMKITGKSHDLLFKDFIIKDASGYSFHVYDPAKVFDGTKESTFYNFKWENVVVDGKTNGAAICNCNYSLANMQAKSSFLHRHDLPKQIKLLWSLASASNEPLLLTGLTSACSFSDPLVTTEVPLLRMSVNYLASCTFATASRRSTLQSAQTPSAPWA